MAPGSPLRRALAPLRRRLHAQRLTLDVAWGASAGSLAAVGTLLLGTWFGKVGPPAALAVGVVVTLAVTMLRAWARRNCAVDVLAAARIAEARSGWQERLSTALEQEERTDEVAAALRNDAEVHVAYLDVRWTAPWTVPGRPIAWIVCAAIAFGLITLAPMAPPSGVGAEVAGATVTNALQSLADAAEREAERADDDGLRGLANELRSLVNDVEEHGFSVGPQSRLDSLLSELTSEVGRTRGAAELRGHVLQVQAELRAAMATADADAVQSRAELDDTRASDVRGPIDDAEGDAQPIDDAVFRLASDWIDEDDADVAFSAGGPPSTERMTLSDVALDSMGDVPDGGSFDTEPAAGGEGEIIGAAADSDAGDSLLAGFGSQALQGPTDAAAHDLHQELMSLTGFERDDGRRIEVEVPPAPGTQPNDPRVFAIGAWVAQPEEAVSSDPTPFRYRSAAADYFLPSQETDAIR
jgi:hypothetical protein